MFEEKITDPEFDWFVAEVKKKLDLDLSGYKSHRVKRRTDILLRKYNVTSYKVYMDMVLSDAKKKDEFLDKLTINVTEFFRNPEKWEALRKVYIPLLLKRSPRKIKIWSAGCSSGEEPYSMAILLEELHTPPGCEVLATDIDQGVLTRARRGVYEERAFTSTSPEILKKYFQKNGDGRYEVVPALKKRIQFKSHNMLQQPFEKDLDMIVCRNVVIYFEMETKNQLYTRFVDALKPGGVLFVGSTERIFNYRQLGLKILEPFVYGKEE
ncbi:MAG TPA: protein-glutamate O-methyltransferase CheR [Thermotogota bacterium]|nr:protein-glutamate O-methyltransferase CheR [Thermotogota bacterium]HRW93450.1 protein-glutamate O-methyltransferase CheR [Thermotogota bacterium]